MDEENRKEDGSYMTPTQKEHLVEFMRKHYEFLFGTKTQHANAKKKKLWELLTYKLNSIGPKKEIDGWKRCFISLKAATKKKFKKMQENQELKLTDVEMKIVQFCKMNSEGGFTSVEDTNIVVLRIQNAATDFVPNQLLNHEENHRGCYEGANAVEDGITTAILEQQHAPDLQLHQQMNLSLVPQPLPLLQEEYQNATLKQKQKKTQNAALKQKEKEPQNATLEQKQKLVDLIGQNFDALYGRVSNSMNGDLIKKKVWRSIALDLNQIGAKKQVDFWKRCFVGLKASTKDKLTILRQNKNKAESDPILVEFNDFDTKIIKMYKLNVMDGSKKLKELGLKPRVDRTIQFTSSTVTLRDDCLLPLQTVEPIEHEQMQRQVQYQEQQQDSLEQEQDVKEPPPQPLQQPQSPQPITTLATTATTTIHATTTALAITSAHATTCNTATTTMPQQQRPQRRGVEINPYRYIEARGIPDFYDDEDRPRGIPDFDDDEDRRSGMRDFDDGEDRPRRPRRRPDRRRRHRVTIPLSVMAVNSLREQKKTNSLLAELLFEFRNRP